jgi:hypothetical protein
MSALSTRTVLGTLARVIDGGRPPMVTLYHVAETGTDVSGYAIFVGPGWRSAAAFDPLGGLVAVYPVGSDEQQFRDAFSVFGPQSFDGEVYSFDHLAGTVRHPGTGEKFSVFLRHPVGGANEPENCGPFVVG